VGFEVQAESLRAYEITDELWRGSEGLAAYCVDAHTGRRFLMKEIVLPADPEERERWSAAAEQRAQRWTGAGWRGVTPLLRIERGGRTLRMIYEDARGLCVNRLAEEAHVLSAGQACRTVLRIAERVDGLRRSGAEISVFEPHCAFMISDEECVWADLSLNEIALSMGGALAEGGEYVPPEIAKAGARNRDERAVVYGLGVFLYRLLTGKRPEDIEGETPLWVLNPQVSSALDRLVQRAVAKDPGQRFASLAEMIEALNRLPEGERYQAAGPFPEAAAPAEEPAAQPRPGGRAAALWLAGAGFVFICVAGLMLALSLRGGKPTPREVAPPPRLVPRGVAREVAPLPTQEPSGGQPAPETGPRGPMLQPPRVTAPQPPVGGGAAAPRAPVAGAGARVPPTLAAPPPAGPPTAAQARGGLRVVVRPVGAEVYVDGAFVGVAAQALVVPGLAAGPHQVRVQMSGYRPRVTEVSVPRGGTAMVSVTLEREGQGP